MFFSEPRAKLGTLTKATDDAIAHYQFSAPVPVKKQMGSNFRGNMGAAAVQQESTISRYDGNAARSERGEILIPVRAVLKKQTQTTPFVPSYTFK